jgi:hypothetical protein
MKRFHSEIPLMVRRYAEEYDKHVQRGSNPFDCHCARGIGFMRKRRVWQSHSPNQHCRACQMDRAEASAERRAVRRSKRKVIAEWFMSGDTIP